MPITQDHKFGPGAREAMVLKTWVSKVDGGQRRVTAHLTGTYTVYCGMGNEHDVEIDERVSAWSGEKGELEEKIFDLHFNYDAVDTRHEIADQLIEYQLEDWFDPCELEDEL